MLAGGAFEARPLRYCCVGSGLYLPYSALNPHEPIAWFQGGMIDGVLGGLPLCKVAKPRTPEPKQKEEEEVCKGRAETDRLPVQ